MTLSTGDARSPSRAKLSTIVERGAKRAIDQLVDHRAIPSPELIRANCVSISAAELHWPMASVERAGTELSTVDNRSDVQSSSFHRDAILD